MSKNSELKKLFIFQAKEMNPGVDWVNSDVCSK